MIAHLDDRIVLRISGEGVRDFLNGLVTNDVAGLTPETPVWAALLSAQGKYIADMMLFDGGADGVLIDAPADRAADLEKKLRLYRLRRPIAIEASPLKVFAAWDEADLLYPADPRHPDLGRRWIAETAVTDAAADWHAHRLRLGIPDSPDFEPDRLMWLEANAAELNGVSFAKGCFVGQENTARMNYRGKVRKRLLPVRLAADPGEERAIVAAGGSAGTLMSRRGRRGIAHLKLEQASTPLTLAGAPVSIDWPDWLERGADRQAEGADG